MWDILFIKGVKGAMGWDNNSSSFEVLWGENILVQDYPTKLVNFRDGVAGPKLSLDGWFRGNLLFERKFFIACLNCIHIGIPSKHSFIWKSMGANPYNLSLRKLARWVRLGGSSPNHQLGQDLESDHALIWASVLIRWRERCC